MQHKVV